MNLFEDNGAEFSPCGKYRYKLWRIWDSDKPKAMCIGLNPSTANATRTDATITHSRLMLAKLGFGGFYMMNLFAWISSKPADLLTCEDPLGENETKLQEVEALCDEVIICWGNFKQAESRIKEVLPRYPDAKCFALNGNGTPCHPLAMMYAGMTKNPKLLHYASFQTIITRKLKNIVKTKRSLILWMPLAGAVVETGLTCTTGIGQKGPLQAM